jgi:hypothetical protein
MRSLHNCNYYVPTAQAPVATGLPGAVAFLGRSPTTSSRHPGIGCSCSTSWATPIGITSPRRFCSHSVVSTSARFGRMKNTARPGNGCRCSFPRPSRLIVQNRPFISMRKVFFSDSTTSPRSLGSRGALLFRPCIVLRTGISDLPPRSRTHAYRLTHFRFHGCFAGDFRYRGSVDKLMTKAKLETFR